MVSPERYREKLGKNATVAIIGGGPAGSFFALHLLRISGDLNYPPKIILFESSCRVRHDRSGAQRGPYEGCPRCAGGISPRLSDALAELDLKVPPDVLQKHLRSISVQGRWKPVHFSIPEDRRMLSVFRGTLPKGQEKPHAAFDAMLLDAATQRGAEVIGKRVTRVYYDTNQRPVLCYDSAGIEQALTADFVAFAGGINDRPHRSFSQCNPIELFGILQPAYCPLTSRKAIIFELAVPSGCAEVEESCVYYLESSVQRMRLDMCSILPKEGYFTISLIGPDVDGAKSKRDNNRIIDSFLDATQTRQILPLDADLRVICTCNPNIVTGTAKMPFSHRAAAVGDMATTRQYKDGILAAHDMARALALTITKTGIDKNSLASGYWPIVDRFRRDNKYAALIFNLYRWFFQSPTWSRIIYQTFVTERKSRHKHKRNFEKLFWSISSGDDDYKAIARSMLSPATAWHILIDGICITLRNRLAERFFGLNWENLGRFPVAEPVERLHEMRAEFGNGKKLDFECVYTIRIRASPVEARRLLSELGEPGRPYLNPRWVIIQRIFGEPLKAGCIIQYKIFGKALSFQIVQKESGGPNCIQYQVLGGFADGGCFQFMIKPTQSGSWCALTVYLTFDYAKGHTPAEHFLWRIFRLCFPEFIHDVLWNHALCQFKQAAESRHLSTGKRPLLP